MTSIVVIINSKRRNYWCWASLQMIVLMVRKIRGLQRIVNKLNMMCKRRELQGNVGNGKVEVFGRTNENNGNFAKPYRVRAAGRTEGKI